MAITASQIKELRELSGAGMLDVKKALEENNGDMEAALNFLREKGMVKAAKKSGRIAAEGIVSLITSDDNRSAAMIEVNSETDFVAKNESFLTFVNELAKVAYDNKISDIETLKTTKVNAEQTASESLTDLIAKIGENMSMRRVVYVEADAVSTYVHGNRIAVIVGLSTEADPASVQALGKDIAMQVASMNPKYISSDDVDQNYLNSEKEVLMVQALNENAQLEASGKKGKPVQIIEKMVTGRLQKELQEVVLLEQAFIKDGDMTVGKYIEQKARELGKSIKVNKIVRFEVGEGLEKKEENFAEEVQKQIG